MTTSRRTPSVVHAVLLLVFTLTACDPNDGIPGRPPTFLLVVPTGDGLVTGYRPDDATSEWRLFTHSDVLEQSQCGDMAVAPDGIMRHLAVLRRGADNTWALGLRTGLGPANWSSELSTIPIPTIQGSAPNVPASICQQLRIAHLRDNLFGIVWIADGTLHNAVFTAGEESPGDIAVGPVFGPIGGTSTTSVNASLVQLNDNPVLVFSNPDRTRIHTLTGTLTPQGITFAAGATTEIAHEALSDVVVQDGAMFVATIQGDSIRLLRKAGAENWRLVAKCSSSATGIRGGLLYADGAGAFHATEIIGTGVTQLRTFIGCGRRNFVLPVTVDRLKFHPGAGDIED